ncbi:MAG: AI-2E family transporter [Halobacteriales archaeon]|nr:AI-2E family transporter [Halobacteriales archaeon]
MAMHVPEDRSRVAWWLLGLALAGVVGFVVVTFIGTFVFGLFLYYATRPIYSRLKRRIRPPSLAAGLSLFALALPALLLLAYALGIALQELSRIANVYDLAALEAVFGPYLDVSTLPVTPSELATGDGLDAVASAVQSASTYVGFLGIGALHLFVMIAIAFYLLRDDHKLARWGGRRFGGDSGVLESYARAVDRSFHQVFFGNILNAAMTGTIGAVVYSLLDLVPPGSLPGGIPYPTLLGLLAGAASLIPIVGMKLIYFPAGVYLLAVTLLNGDPTALWYPAAFFGLSFVVVDTIPDLVLRPYVSGRSLHVGMLMLAYIFGPLLFGWYGIFLGPMLLVLVVQFVRLVLPELVAGVPIRPVAVDPSNLIGAQTEPEGAEAPETATDAAEPADG